GGAPRANGTRVCRAVRYLPSAPHEPPSPRTLAVSRSVARVTRTVGGKGAPMAAKDVFERLLSPVEVRAVVPAAPNAVFAVLADPETYPDWLSGAQRIRRVDGQFPAPGSEFHHEVGPSDEVTIADHTKVVAVDPPNQLALEVHA